MTVDEMIQEIEDSHIYLQSIHEGYGSQIIAALKAGQAMKVKAQEFVELAECDGDEDLITAIEAWDDATKGER